MYETQKVEIVKRAEKKERGKEKIRNGQSQKKWLIRLHEIKIL